MFCFTNYRRICCCLVAFLSIVALPSATQLGYAQETSEQGRTLYLPLIQQNGASDAINTTILDPAVAQPDSNASTPGADAQAILVEPNVSAANGPTLAINRSGNNLQLSWTTVPGSQGYEVHRSSTPFFAPSAATLLQSFNSNTTTFTDVGVVGNVTVNHFYLVQAVNGNQKSRSNEVGEIEYALNNSGGKYSLIALPFPSTTIVNAATLASHIGSVNAMLKWNPATQSFRFFIPPASGDNFAVTVGDAIFVLMNSGGPTVVTMMGNVVGIQHPLKPGGFSFVSMPLQTSNLTNASGVATDITNVQGLFVWNQATQLFRFFAPPNAGDNFTLTTGQPFIVQLASGSPTIWPTAIDGQLPPDPSTVAPQLDETLVTDFLDANSFLFTGNNPIQTGVVSGTITYRQAAVLRGKVVGRDGAALPDVAIRVLNHPEFGQTRSRADGMFDMVVNGGEILTVSYERAGYLPVQRQVSVPWRDYLWLPDVVLTPLDPVVTEIELGAGAAMQVARGSVITDSDGTRQQTILFPAGMTAVMTLTNGTTQTLPILSVRATEFTVGANGPSAMPGDLPINSAYTYAFELSVDQAIQAGAQAVGFNQPVSVYNENFLNFPAGTIAPVGYYDRARGLWLPTESGLVIAIVGVTSGMAELDVDGSGAPASPAALAALGISNDERIRLAQLYAVGQSIWRIQVRHFSAWDVNWGTRCKDDDCEPPDIDDPKVSANEVPDPDCQNGSIIECQNRVIGEQVGIAGTPFSLHYRSNRVSDYKPLYAVDIPLTGDSFHPRVKLINLVVRVAGREFRTAHFPVRNLTVRFVWDGLDAYGRDVQGAQRVYINVGWEYEMEYISTSRFGYNGNGVSISADVARSAISLWKQFSVVLNNLQIPRRNLGGWSLDVQHMYDPSARMLYRGDGSRQTATAFGPVVDTVPAIDGGNNAGVNPVVAADGSLFVADLPWRIVRIAPDGTKSVFAGNGPRCTTPSAPCGDGGPALQASLGTLEGLALGPDGALYLSDSAIRRIRRIGTDGIIRTIAGTGAQGGSGDGGPALQATLQFVGSIAVGRDGSVYFGQEGNGPRVRRIAPDGIITTFAGGGISQANVVTATSANVNPRGLAIAPDGSLYIAATSGGPYRIRHVRPDGMIETVAGNGSAGALSDGVPALQARFGTLQDIEFGADGSLYIADIGSHLVRRMGQDGILTTVGGNGQACQNAQPCGDGGAALQAAISPFGVAASPDGELYIWTAGYNRIRRLRPALPQSLGRLEQFIASADGGEIYAFAGRHTRTLDARTGALRYAFAYNSVGNLLSVTDGDGNVTTIERDAGGLPTAIVGPYGQRTGLMLDANGFLAAITNPADESILFSYSAGGLLATMTTPRGHTYNFTYNSAGQLTRDTAPNGGFKGLAQVGANESYSVTVSSALNRATLYGLIRQGNGNETRITIDPAGLQQRLVKGKDDVDTLTAPDGTIIRTTLGPDPRFAMQAPLQQQRFSTPGGITHNLQEQRAISLTNALNPLSINTLTESLTVNGRVFSSLYLSATRQVTSTSPLGRQTVTTLDRQGRPLQVTAAGFLPFNYEYDERGRLVSIQQGSRFITITYNSAGFPATLSDSLNRVTSFAYDETGRVISQTLPGARTVSFAYDANGNLTALTPPGRPAHTFSYTSVDQMANYAPPNVGAGSNQTLYTYNLDRQITQISRPDGQSISMGYDAAGRLQTMGMPGRTLTYGYAPVTGNLHTLGVTNGVTLTYSYDGALPKDESWSGIINGSVSRSFDNNLHVTSRSVNGGNPITFQYNQDEQLTQAGALALHYHPQTGLLTSTLVNTLVTAYTYNGYGELTGHSAAIANNNLHTVQLSHDNAGRIDGKSEVIDGITTVYSYTYDVAGRLQSEIVNGVVLAAYTYDANGNRLSVTRPNGVTNASYDNQDRLLQYGATTYAYTANGELVSQSTANQTTQYSYDVLGNLLTVALPNGTNVSYVVDGRNRRVGRKVNGVLTHGWLYQDQLKPLAELDGNGAVVATYVYALFANVPELMIKGGVTYRLLTDHLGSVRLVVNTANGQVVQRMDYDAFGRVLTDTNPGFQPFGFAGGLYDPLTGLVRFGARDYDATIGRWTAKDPIGFEGGEFSLYSYVLQNPVNLHDSAGLAWYDDLSDFAAGFGDNLTTLPFTNLSLTRGIRKALDVNDVVNPCSSTYRIGEGVGIAYGLATGWAGGLNGGAKSVFWAGYNQGAREAARQLGTTIDKTPIGFVLDRLGVQNRTVWVAASATFAANAKGTAKAVIRSLTPKSIWHIEKKILNSRGIPINYYP